MFDKQYFIKKFLRIPDKLWVTNTFGYASQPEGEHCALGHCKQYGWRSYTDESRALIDIMKIDFNSGAFSQYISSLEDKCVTYVNDKFNLVGYKSPKQAVLCELIKRWKSEITI